jgi:hypothetical protein
MQGAILWPNGLGWDVGPDAEVWRFKDGLGVRIFTSECKIRFLFISDLSLDPVAAVQRCEKEGTIQEDNNEEAMV